MRCMQVDSAQADMLTAALMHRLSSGLKPLLSVLCSSPAGLQLFFGDAQLTATWLAGLSPTLMAPVQGQGEGGKQQVPMQGQGEGGKGQLPASTKELAISDAAAAFSSLLVARAAVEDLVSESATLHSPSFARAVHVLVSLLGEGNTARHAAVAMLAQHAQRGLPRLVEMVELHCTLVAEMVGGGGLTHWQQQQQQQAQHGQEGESGALQLLSAAPACVHGASILEAFTLSMHPDVVGLWAAQAPGLRAALEDCADSLQQLGPGACDGVWG
jgi:hypothetical protein